VLLGTFSVLSPIPHDSSVSRQLPTDGTADSRSSDGARHGLGGDPHELRIPDVDQTWRVGYRIVCAPCFAYLPSEAEVGGAAAMARPIAVSIS